MIKLPYSTETDAVCVLEYFNNAVYVLISILKRFDLFTVHRENGRKQPKIIQYLFVDFCPKVLEKHQRHIIQYTTNQTYSVYVFVHVHFQTHAGF